MKKSTLYSIYFFMNFKYFSNLYLLPSCVPWPLFTMSLLESLKSSCRYEQQQAFTATKEALVAAMTRVAVNYELNWNWW